MKKYPTIDAVMQYAKEKHPIIGPGSAGGYGVVLLRKHDGRRIVVQEMRYFRIFKHEVVDDITLVIYNIVTGLSYKGSKIQSASSTLYLNDLIQINVYDHTTHFISRAGIDFSYMIEDTVANIQALQEFIHDQHGVVRASWTNPDSSEDELLDAFGFGQKVLVDNPYKRFIGVTMGDEV